MDQGDSGRLGEPLGDGNKHLVSPPSLPQNPAAVSLSMGDPRRIMQKSQVPGGEILLLQEEKEINNS